MSLNISTSAIIYQLVFKLKVAQLCTINLYVNDPAESQRNLHFKTYSKTCVKRPLPKRPKIGFQDQLSLNAGQKYSAKGNILQYF